MRPPTGFSRFRWYTARRQMASDLFRRTAVRSHVPNLNNDFLLGMVWNK